MRPLSEMSPDVCRRIELIFTDIDDTLTTGGLIPAVAFDAVWKARDAGIRVVLVTGRPAGWCDHLARMWPVAGVVGENGALAFSMQGGKIKRIYAERRSDAKERLEEIRKQVLAEVPGCKVAADQPYREYDLAVDFCEEVKPLPEEAVDRIVEIFEAHGATAKVSSIHVNGWFGSFDKLSMCRRAAAGLFGAELDADRAVYVGDSPNDEPMFKAFPHGCGVANVRNFANRMKALPAFVANAEGGEGFAEVVGHILANRN